MWGCSGVLEFILSLFLFAAPQKYRQNNYVVALNRFYHNVAPLGLIVALTCHCYHNVASNEAFYSTKQCLLSNKFDSPSLHPKKHKTQNNEQ